LFKITIFAYSIIPYAIIGFIYVTNWTFHAKNLCDRLFFSFAVRCDNSQINIFLCKSFLSVSVVISVRSVKEMISEIRKIHAIIKEMQGKPMSREQLKFQDVLRAKVKAKEITVEEAHKIWNEKYGVRGD